MSTLNVANITDGTDTVETGYVVNGSAKAWVNFDGTGTVAIRDSVNVSSLVDSGAGNYSINFTNNMDPSYSAIVSVRNENGAVSSTLAWASVGVSGFGMYSWNSTPVPVDVSTACALAHGDLA
jgi:hypothetical protein